MTQPITSPFRWAEHKRPSVLATDHHFNGRKNTPRPNAAPKANTNFNVPIVTLAEADRTNIIRGKL